MTTYDHVVALALDGLRPGDIARRLNLHVQTVYAKIRLARARGIDIPRTSCRGVAQPRRSIPVPPAVRDALEPFATARGITPIELGGRILRKVAEDRLVEAVLDDGGRNVC